MIAAGAALLVVDIILLLLLLRIEDRELRYKMRHCALIAGGAIGQ